MCKPENTQDMISYLKDKEKHLRDFSPGRPRKEDLFSLFKRIRTRISEYSDSRMEVQSKEIATKIFSLLFQTRDKTVYTDLG